jgi:hypothetical protein
MRVQRCVISSVVVILGSIGIAPSPLHAIGGDAGQQSAVGWTVSPPPDLSTSGDYATDTFGDPWDFSNDNDVLPINGVGAFAATGVSVGDGVLTVATRDAAEIRLVMNWSQTSSVLPWGRDGWAHPIDADRYTQTTFRIRSDAKMNMSIRWFNEAGQEGVIPFTVEAGDWQTIHFDLADHANYPFPTVAATWAGRVVRFELFRAPVTGNPTVNVQLDWVRLHRADAPREPVTDVAVPQVITPGEATGADYATVERGNAWDFHGLDDVDATRDVTSLSIDGNGDLTGVTTGNDPSIGLPLAPTLNTDRYHHLSIDVCYGGGFSLEDVVGGGMVGRMTWTPHGTTTVISTQDFVIFPGCHTINIDLATNPPGAVNDESTIQPTGWRGVRIDSLRFELAEDRGPRAFTLRNISLTDDSAFSSTYPITFRDAANTSGARADVFATTTRGGFDGVRIANGLSVGPGINTFNWNGTDESGAQLPNSTYWIYVVIHAKGGSGVGYSTGPARIERAVPSTPSYFIPVTPARLLDTRNGVGGNLSPLAEDSFTELAVTGVGGVPAANVTAVVLNVTVTNTTGDGYITVSPSGETRPIVSNINFVPGQTVPNLVTVKLGANGRVNIYNSAGSTDVIADVAGYYTSVAPPSGGHFTALTPARLLDTRDGTGTSGVGALGLNQQINLGVVGVGGVPSTGVTAVALNVTVADPTGTGYLTVWPAGEARPTASTHNFEPGLTVANLVLAKVGAGGQVSIFNSAGLTHVVADVTGYFSSTGGLFVPVTPRRLVDSRDGTGGVNGTIGTATLPIASGSPVPATATAAVINATSVDSTIPSYITVWPTGSDRPLASTLNPRPGVAVPNQAYLRLGTSGQLSAFNANGTTNFIADVFGYFVGS